MDLNLSGKINGNEEEKEHHPYKVVVIGFRAGRLVGSAVCGARRSQSAGADRAGVGRAGGTDATRLKIIPVFRMELVERSWVSCSRNRPNALARGWNLTGPTGWI